jgi:hypothetical protein
MQYNGGAAAGGGHCSIPPIIVQGNDGELFSLGQRRPNAGIKSFDLETAPMPGYIARRHATAFLGTAPMACNAFIMVAHIFCATGRLSQ